MASLSISRTYFVAAAVFQMTRFMGQTAVPSTAASREEIPVASHDKTEVATHQASPVANREMGQVESHQVNPIANHMSQMASHEMNRVSCVETSPVSSQEANQMGSHGLNPMTDSRSNLVAGRGPSPVVDREPSLDERGNMSLGGKPRRYACCQQQGCPM